jgi:rod shape-determining protein MreD
LAEIVVLYEDNWRSLKSRFKLDSKAVLFEDFNPDAMKYLFLALSSFLAIIAQMIAGNNFYLFNFLDLSLLLVAYWAIYRSRSQALFVGCLTGLLLDAAFGWSLGYNGFGKTLAAFVIGQSWKHFNTGEQAWMRFLILAAASCVNSLSIFVLFWLMEHQIMLKDSVLKALITAAVGIITFAGFETFKRIQAHKAH